MVATSTFCDTGFDAPAHGAVAVTPNNDTDLTTNTRGLYVGGAGNLVVVMASEANAATTVTFTGVAAGTVLPIRVRRVKSTNTTATSIVALY